MNTRYGRKQVRKISALVVVAAFVALVAVAVASTYGRTVVALPFTTPRPAASTGLRISIHYQDEHDPNAKPKTFHKLEIQLPSGFEVKQRVVPACTASDSELMAKGPSACPRSKVGDGTVSLMTGFPPPEDTFATDVTVLQGQGEWLDVFRAKGASQTLAVDHIKITGRTLVDEPQSVPGGPPDGRSAVRDVRIRIGARTARGRAYLRTPPRCPSERRWESRFTVFYDDGVTDVARATSPCSPRARRPAMKLTVSPHRVTAGARVRVRFHVRSAIMRCRRGVVIRLAGERVLTNRRGNAALIHRFRHAGRRRAVATKVGCRHAVARVRVVRDSG